MSGPRVGLTADARFQGGRERDRKDALRELRRDVTELLTFPQFRRYMNHVCRGRLGHGSLLWRSNVADMARAVTMSDAGGELLKELREIDPQGFRLLLQEHEKRVAEELSALAQTEEQEHDD